jgi:hypothetical protein
MTTTNDAITDDGITPEEPARQAGYDDAYDDGREVGKLDAIGSFVTAGAMTTKDFTPSAWPISGEYGDADGIDVLAVRYIEVSGFEILEPGKIRLNAANARRFAVTLIDAAHDFDGGGVLPDDVRRTLLPTEKKEGNAA